ncbi:MAG: hypothetical protein M9924_19660 [Rhizobiaceae bacterium]|nr:hypothetical protein [Rhizobiaceae bacterium]
MSGLLKRFLPAASQELTLPAMDGPFRPNSLLDLAPSLSDFPAPDCLASLDDNIYVTSGRDLYRLNGTKPPLRVRHCENSISSLAFSQSGAVALGLVDGRILVFDNNSNRTIEVLGEQKSVCPTALLFDGQDLIVAQGSSRVSPEDWVEDLLRDGASGSVWRVSLKNGNSICLAHALAYPNGLLLDAKGELIVSEAWRHRLIRLPRDARNLSGSGCEVVLADLPGYPARLAPSSRGGAWLSIFAPRSQLVDYVLRQPEFCARMISEVPDRREWIAPRLRAGNSVWEPLMGGAMKQMGRSKPWAPSFSYGMVVYLDHAFQPESSVQSRADGNRHGTTGCVEHKGKLFVACKGDDAVAILDLAKSGGVHVDAA